MAGCCAWAIDVGMLVPPQNSDKILTWAGLLGAGMLAAFVGRAVAGWSGCAVVMGAMALAGWIAIPRRVASRFDIRYRSAAKRAGEMHRRSDVSQLWPVVSRFGGRKKGTTWFDVLLLVGQSSIPWR